MERLINYFIPENYNLELRVNKYTEEVQGHVAIRGKLTSNTLKLHARDLRISKILINNQAVNFELDLKNQLLNIIPPESIQAKSYDNIMIDVRYTFKLNHSMIGMYLSTYQYQGKEERIISTQFESHYARMMFPCIDEPEAKATFDLKIINTDTEDTILSNMPAESERILTYNSVDANLDPKADANALNLNTEVSRKVIIFKTTPKMSTYLLAICIGRFNKTSDKNHHGVTVSTYAALNQSTECLEFSNQIALEALDFYDQLFGIPYPLPKLDQVAIPDFDAGAMENWGLVTYRESCLLADQNTPKTTKEYIATVVTHELSHQWFGNLVTMEWWDNLWLNESFANIMQFYAVDHLRPDWQIWQDYFAEDCLYALRRDSLKNVQSVQQPVSDPAEIDSLFDGAIVYAKGSRLILMLMREMGEQNFFKGLKDYFKKYQYRNTTGDDLWNCLQKHASFQVKELMNSWITQPGFPIIDGCKQQRFFADGTTDQTTWRLPKISDDMTGHYLIKLSESEFQYKISNFSKLQFEQKLRLLIDRELLMRTPLIKTSSLLELLPRFSKEIMESTWQIIATILSGLKIFFPPNSLIYPLYQEYISTLISENITRLGLTPLTQESSDDLKLRPLILNLAIYADDQKVLSQLSKIYDQKIGRQMNFSAVSPEILDSVITAKFRFQKESLFEQLLKRYQEESNPNYRSVILDVLADSRVKGHILKLINLLEDQNIVRLQDHLSLLSDLLANFWAKDQALGWFYEHWDYIQMITHGKSIDDYIRVVGSRIATRQEAITFQQFCRQHQTEPAIARAIKIAENNINTTLSWYEREVSSVHRKITTVMNKTAKIVKN